MYKEVHLVKIKKKKTWVEEIIAGLLNMTGMKSNEPNITHHKS